MSSCRTRHDGNIPLKHAPTHYSRSAQYVETDQSSPYLPKTSTIPWFHQHLQVNIAAKTNIPSFPSFKILHILVQTTTTEFTNVPIPPIDMLTTSPSAKVNSGGGIVPVPVQTVVPFGT